MTYRALLKITVGKIDRRYRNSRKFNINSIDLKSNLYNMTRRNANMCEMVSQMMTTMSV